MTRASDRTGFSVVEVLLIVVIIGILGFTGWFVYHSKQAADKNLTVSNSTVPTYKKQVKATTSPTVSNPYAGWETATLKYEKLSFKYPSSWQISNTSTPASATETVSPGTDQAILTSPTGLEVAINTGGTGIGASDGIDSVQPGSQMIHTLGGTYYLDYYTNLQDSTSSTAAQAACLDKTATVKSGAPYIPSQNITYTSVSGVSNEPAVDLVCMQYKKSVPEKTISTFEKDASYNDAKLIIESLTY